LISQFNFSKFNIYFFQEPNKDYTINMGSRGYVRNNVHLSQKIKANLEYHYKLQMEQTNLDDTVQLASTINDWVKEISQGKISSLVDSESLSNAAMLLLNAVYFRGLWRLPFEETISRGFQVEPNMNVTKEFVEQTSEFYYSYSKTLSARLLRLPYEGHRFSMFVVLPFEADGLDDLIDQLDAETLSKEIDNMELTTVHVVLPKFRFDSSTKLNSVIKAVKKVTFSNSLKSITLFFDDLARNQRDF
jgi:serpin A